MEVHYAVCCVLRNVLHGVEYATEYAPTEPMLLTQVKPSWFGLLPPLAGHRGSFAESLEPEWGRPFTGQDTQSFSPHGSSMLEGSQA